ncbi:surface antigen-like protein [Leishmania major strain Friedlin]|uniref:Surface antigen-like protein n=1 Tax=Leishmania major TaxID=5664 RepID=E9ACQ0_LEIMA|nr:surface antigen-like protein [Leishmania major strain Friedlin]CAG9568302.1 surface_antigen-like_protein [Leishmania major strain Friedlin]CBZ05780.1 surface antigen-like protein [Leishmania major strain Friedlin]|eukprot:XP_003721775.1 surface antigen-like protein [Leishmania major strain Friedlin]
MALSLFSLIGAAAVTLLLLVAAPSSADTITVNAATQAWLKMWIESIPNLGIIWLNPNICSRAGIECVSATNSINIRLDGVTSAGFNFIGTLPEVDSSIDGDELQITSVSVRGKTRFTGTIPASWSRITRLTHLDFSRTRISGRIPDELGSLAALMSVDFSNSYFCYGLPNWNASSMPMLSQAIFTNNNMRGPFASSWSTFPASLKLDITGNKLCGCMPSSWDSKPNLVAAAKAMDAGTVSNCFRSCNSASLSYCPASPVGNGAQMITMTTAVVGLVVAVASLVF